MATSRRSDRRETTTRKMRIQFSATGDKRVVAAFERVDQGARNSTQGLEGFRGSLLSIDAAMDIASTSLGALQTAFDAIKVPVGLAVDWEHQFALIKTLNSEIGDDLEQKLLKLAASVPQTAGDVAQSAYSAISAGIDPAEVVGFLEAASKAAVAGNATMAESTTALTKTLAGYKQAGLEAERAMDVLFATVKRGDTSFTDLASSVGMVAGAAGSAGVSAEEMGAAIATLSKSAPNTSIAVTQLNALIKALQADTGVAANNIRKMGLETGAANLKAKGLAQVLKEIKARVGDDVTAINSLTNSMEAQAAFNTLLSGQMDEYLADLSEVTNSVGALSTAHGELSETTQTAISSFEALKEGAIRDIGQELLPDVNRGLREFGEWWESNGKAVTESIKVLYRTSVALFDAFRSSAGIIDAFTGDLSSMAESTIRLAEAMGIIPAKVEEVADAFKEARAEADKFAADQRDNARAFIKASEDAVKAIIKRGDVAAAQGVREAQVEALRVRHMQQEAETLQRFYRMEALERMKAEAAEGTWGEARVARIDQELSLMRVRQNAALKDNDAVLEAMRNLQDLNVKTAIAEEKARKGARPKKKARPERVARPAAPQTGFIAEALERFTADTERAARETVERRVAFERELQDRRIDLIADGTAREILALTVRHQREMELARVQGQDVLALRAVQEDEINALMEEKSRERRQMEAQRMNEWATDFRAGTAETLTAMEQIAAGAEAIGISGDAAQKALAYTRALVSAADAISYTAQSAAAFASFNPFSGFKYGAAAVGAAAAAAAYFKAAGKGGDTGGAGLATGAGGGSGATVAQSARASESDLGRRRSSSSGPTTLTYQLNFNAPVFDTQGNVDRAIAEAARRQQRAPGGVSIISPSEIKRAARV